MGKNNRRNRQFVCHFVFYHTLCGKNGNSPFQRYRKDRERWRWSVTWKSVTGLSQCVFVEMTQVNQKVSQCVGIEYKFLNKIFYRLKFTCKTSK